MGVSEGQETKKRAERKGRGEREGKEGKRREGKEECLTLSLYFKNILVLP